jgi:hypothetical protein
MADPRKFLLVIQLPINSVGDFDRMVEAEERIDALLKGLGQVDGHDAGSGEGNIFIFTDHPELAFQKALPCLEEPVRELARAAYRETEGETFTILWPSGLKEFRVL